METQTEAFKLALEALEKVLYDMAQHKLAQPEQEPVQREPLELALEALEKVSTRSVIMGSTGDYREGQLDALSSVSQDIAPAITAIKEALAQQEQPAQQEPVAHRDDFWCADLTCKKCYSADFRFKHKNSVVNESLTTPAQRTWVGLTDEKIEEIAAKTLFPVPFARAIEAELKE